MEFITLVLGDYQTNCYLVYDKNKNCALIDPGYEPERILSAAREYGLNIRAIFLTHGHFDHVGAVKALAEATHVPVWLNEKELTLPVQITAGPLYCTDFLEDGEKISVGELEFTVLSTPGHTPGSVCLACQGVLFTGDTLFAGSCGRVDLPGGVPWEMMGSLNRLKNLPGDYQICPGHGPESSLSWERKTNPYLRAGL